MNKKLIEFNICKEKILLLIDELKNNIKLKDIEI
jgi:hypothetical protein